MNYLRSLNKASLIAYSLITLALVIIFSTTYFVWNIDVVRDWKLVVPQQPIHAGDTIIVESRYTKLRDITPGYAKRYIDCQNKDGLTVSYQINEAIADKTAGEKKATGIEMVMPTIIPNLPATCAIRITVSYPVLPLRTVLETNTSDSFELQPKREPTSSVNESPRSTSTSQSLSQESDQSMSSSSNSTATPQSPQRDSSQETGTTQTTEDTGLINSLLKVIRGTL